MNSTKHHFFQARSTKADGNMSFLYGKAEDVSKNRELFLHKHQLTRKQCVALRTHHSQDIQIVDQTFLGSGMSSIDTAIHADALVTSDKNLVLFLLTADCLPIAFYDLKNEVVALAHLSRENTQRNFSKKIINTFQKQFNSDVQNIIISIGPGIQHESYPLNLFEMNTQQLVGAGVPKRNINSSSIDTYSNLNFFSHRRSVTTGELEGRFATVVQLGNT